MVQKGETIAVDELLAEARATLERGTLPVPAAIRKLAASQPIPEGKRNDTLMRLGASLRAKGLDEDEIRAAPIWCRTQFLIGTTEHTKHTETEPCLSVCSVCSVVKQSIPIAIPIPIWMKP